jgi:hypothetical protein
VTTNRHADHRYWHWFARLFVGLTIVAAAGYTASCPVAAASSSQGSAPAALRDHGDDPGTPSTFPPEERPRIIPRPNSGHPPIDAGDRGGALQFTVLGAIVLGVTGIGFLMYRESRRNLADRQTGAGAGARATRGSAGAGEGTTPPSPR